MYCSACGMPLAPGLSYCNRCGLSLKERSSPDTRTALVSAYLIAIAIIGIVGLVLMLGGAIALKNGALFGEEIVAVFMLMTFTIVSIVEIFLCRQLSRISRTTENQQSLAQPPPMPVPTEFRGPQPRALSEPSASVTENTTRTLEYSRHEPAR